MVTKCGRAAARAVKISAGSLARASTHAGHLRRLWRSRMLSVTLANRAGHALFRLAPLAVFVACFGSVGCRDAARVLGGSSHDAPVASVAASSESLSPAVSSEEKLADERPLKVPNGEAPRLSCAQARSIVAEVRRRLPAAPPSVSPHAFAELWTDWFDPHGLWSAAPDAPLSAAMQARASALWPNSKREMSRHPVRSHCRWLQSPSIGWTACALSSNKPAWKRRACIFSARCPRST